MTAVRRGDGRRNGPLSRPSAPSAGVLRPPSAQGCELRHRQRRSPGLPRRGRRGWRTRRSPGSPALRPRSDAVSSASADIPSVPPDFSEADEMLDRWPVADTEPA